MSARSAAVPNPARDRRAAVARRGSDSPGICILRLLAPKAKFPLAGAESDGGALAVSLPRRDRRPNAPRVSRHPYPEVALLEAYRGSPPCGIHRACGRRPLRREVPEELGAPG